MIKQFLPTEDVARLRALIEQSHKIVLTAHVSPDGDAMGSLTALYQVLKRKNKDVSVIVPNIFPDFLAWLPGASDIYCYEKNESVCQPIIAAADLFFCLDFNALSRLSGLSAPIASHPAPKVMIDHHLYPESFAEITFSYPEMSSTCELLYHLLMALYDPKELTKDEATSIYTGMMTDTGAFTYNSGRSEIYYIIGQLLETGIDKDQIYRNVFYEYSADRFRLLGYLLYVRMEVMSDKHAVLMSLTREEQKRFSHKKGDTEGFVNMPLQISGTKLSIFLRENTEQDNIRVSLRSVGDFPCNRMAAEFFNGGGHLNASGGQLECSLDEAIEIARQAVKKYASLLK